MITLTKTMPVHDCTLLRTDACDTCETYFWEQLAKHNEDEVGLDIFLERRVEALRDHDHRESPEDGCVGCKELGNEKEDE